MATYAQAYSSYPHPPAQQAPSKQQYAAHNPTWVNPPYPGAPPLPAGMSVNPQQWKAGRWQYNPSWNQNHNPHQQHVPWIPSRNWMPHAKQQSNPSHPQQQQQQQQQQQVVNPYKRVPRPPSAEYLATELVENPLGLTGLDEPNKYYDKTQTPWVWQPRDLDDEDQESPSQEQGSGDSPTRSRRNSGGIATDGSFTAKRELQPTFSPSIVRTPEHYRRHSSGSLSSTPSRDSSRGSGDILPIRISQLSIGSSGGSQNSIGSSNHTPSDFSTSSSILGDDQLSDEPSSILSPLIFAQTPKPGPRGLRNHYTHPVINSGNLDTIPEATADPRTPPTRPAPLGPSSSLPIVPTSQGYAPVAQPSSLSFDDRERREKKERKDRPDHSNRRGLGSKHTTFIDPYTSNVYSSNPTKSSPHQNHSPSTASSHSTPSSHSSQPSPNYPSTHASPPSSYSPGPSPPQHKSKHSPPDDNRSLQPQSSPVTAKGIKPEPSTLRHGQPHHHHHQQQQQNSILLPPPLPLKRPSFDNRRRRGYWNRRGDHLTQSGYIVYAPPDKQFPPELRNYPTEEEGYENHDGLFAANANRPELPESLPRGGKPCEKPYDGFVIYEYK